MARPILFSAPMVRALLAGTKTQTRRVVKPTPGAQSKWLTPEGLSRVPSITVGAHDCGFGAQLTHPMGGPGGWIRCPYGQPGDLLWVRECFSINEHQEGCWYWADGNIAEFDCTRPKPSIHMPRWASRLTLEITDVRVERLQAISEADALAEGVREPSLGDGLTIFAQNGGGFIPRGSAPPLLLWEALWRRINGDDSWTANPWVWAVSFNVHRANVDDVLQRGAA